MGLSEEIRRLPEAWRFALVRKGPDGTKKAYERGWPQGIDHTRSSKNSAIRAVSRQWSA